MPFRARDDAGPLVFRFRWGAWAFWTALLGLGAALLGATALLRAWKRDLMAIPMAVFALLIGGVSVFLAPSGWRALRRGHALCIDAHGLSHFELQGQVPWEDVAAVELIPRIERRGEDEQGDTAKLVLRLRRGAGARLSPLGDEVTLDGERLQVDLGSVVGDPEEILAAVNRRRTPIG